MTTNRKKANQTSFKRRVQNYNDQNMFSSLKLKKNKIENDIQQKIKCFKNKKKNKNLNFSHFQRRLCKYKRALMDISGIPNQGIHTIILDFVFPYEPYTVLKKQFHWLSNMIGYPIPSRIFYENHYQTFFGYDTSSHCDGQIPNFYGENSRHLQMLYSNSGKPLFCSQGKCICSPHQVNYFEKI